MGRRKKPTLRLRQKNGLANKRKLILRERATPAEMAFLDKLKKLKVHYAFQKAFIGGEGFAITDFYIAPLKLCIEVDGGYHNTEEQQRKDRWRDGYLRNDRKVKVVRITNEQAIAMTLKDVSDLIGIENTENCIDRPWPAIEQGQKVSILRRQKALRNPYRGRAWFVVGLLPGGGRFSRGANGKRSFVIHQNEYAVSISTARSHTRRCPLCGGSKRRSNQMCARCQRERPSECNMKLPPKRRYSLENDPKYRRARREFEALKKTGSTDSLVFSPLLRAAKDEDASPSPDMTGPDWTR